MFDLRTAELKHWFRLFLQGRWFRRSAKQWLAGVAEACFAAALLLVGIVLLTVNVTWAVINRQPAVDTPSYWLLWIAISLILISIGLIWIGRLLLRVGVSAERRGAIAARANELEILNELRRRRADLPTVPRDPRPPVAGRRLGFQIIPSPRNVWGLISAGVFSMIAVSLLSVLGLISARAFDLDHEWVSHLGAQVEQITPDEFSRIPDRPWLAVALLLLAGPAAAWSIYHFIRQLLKLTGIGPTSIELSCYPLQPGIECDLFLSQTGRVRLKLFNVDLTCQEEVTYNEGTDIRTETSVVYQSRLIRQRGVSLSAGKPFEATLKIAIPDSAMHSFKSTNNRIQWKIVVTAQARNWPRLKRTFPIIVHPRAESPRGAGDRSPRAVVQ